MLTGVGAGIALNGGVLVVEILIGTDSFVEACALGCSKSRGERFGAPPCPAHKQAAMFIAITTMAVKTGFLERGFDARLLSKACERADNGAWRTLEKLLELPNAADEDCLFEESCPFGYWTLFPRQLLQASLYTEAGGWACVNRAPARFGV